MREVVLKRSRKMPYYFIDQRDIDSQLYRAIDEELSYYQQGYEYSDDYKSGRWDGKIHLLKQTRSGDFYFPAGLLERVLRVLEGFGVKYRVVDTIDTDYSRLGLEWHGYELRPYQQKAVEQALQAGKGVIALPTGAGKTLIGLRLIYSYDCSTLVCVHTKELLYQWHRKIREVLSYDAGLVGDGFKTFKPITVAMMQTLTKIQQLPAFTLLIIDECHHAPCETLYRIAMRVNAPFRFGLSATPRREDGADMKIWAATGEICAQITPEQLINAGYLAKPEFWIISVPMPPGLVSKARRNWQAAYTEGIVRNEQRNKAIKAVVERLTADGRQVYIHVERIAHGQILSKLLNCPFLSGKDSSARRQKVLKDFESGRIKVLVSTLLGEGVDIPAIDAIIMAHGMKTTIGTIQKVGRALRARDDKSSAVIVDFSDKGKYLAEWFEARIRAYREYYGRYAEKMKIIKF